MKKNILNKVLITLLVTLGYTSTFAQLHIDKDFHIADGGTVYVKGVQVTFSAASNTTTTTRTATTYGKLWMDAAASLATIGAASPFATNGHFMDGYVRSDRAAQFIYPVGQLNVLGIVATVGSNTNEIDVAYRRATASSASTTPSFASPLVAASISSVEFWDIIGTAPAKVSLTYDNTRSNFTGLGITTVDQIGIAGLRKSNNTWEIIPSTIGNGTNSNSILTGTSTVTSGSVTTDANVDLSLFRFFTIAKEGCFALPTSTSTVVWNGSNWSPSTPNENTTAQIDALYNGASFTCNALVLNANIDLTGGKFIDCVNSVSGTGVVIMDTNSNFLQRNSTATAPTINMKKVAKDERLNDWTYFGSPLASGKLTAMETAKAVGIGNPTQAYYSYRYWRTGLTNTAENWWGVHSNTGNPSYLNLADTELAITGNNKTGLGFIARVKYQAPFVSLVTQKDIEINLNGLSNNGDFSVPSSTIATTGTTNGPANTRQTLGNPYPSNIDADVFLRENPNITGTLYFWSSKTEYSSGSGTNTAFYTGADFASYNLSGGVASNTGSAVPNKYIHSAQGFDVYTTVISQPITFNNCMRVTSGTPTTFFRTANQTESETNNADINRFWINISNANNEFYNQALIAYIPETTLGYDRMYDGVSASTSAYTLTSLLNNEKFAIQSRSSFNALDVVPLHVKRASTYTGTMTISLSNKEGIFNSNDLTIFLHDKQLNVFHNLEISNYTFTLNELENNNRFEIVYQSTLNTNDFSVNPVNISLFDKNFKVIAKDLISNITIFDISGRLIETYKNINNTEFVSNFNHEDGIYIAKVVLQNGNTVSQKITNLNK